MEFLAWASPGEKRKLFGKAKANGADELTLSDFDSTTGFLGGTTGEDYSVCRFHANHFFESLDDFLL